MSTGNQWTVLLDYCLCSGFKVLPGFSGTDEPWLHLESVAKITGDSRKTVENKCRALKVPRHDIFPLYVQLSEFKKAPPQEKPGRRKPDNAKKKPKT